MQAKQGTAQRMTIRIIDLACGGGAQAVERALGKLPGVLDVYVHQLTEPAYITADSALLDEAAVIRAIAATGCRAGQFAR